MQNKFIVSAAFLGALTVALGAFGAHALKQLVSDQALTTYETAVRYQFYHVFALAITGILYANNPNKLIRNAGIFFMIGITLFSGSLYTLTYIAYSGNLSLSWVGPITPIGGLFLILGWIQLGLGLKRTN
ncbi:MAG: DUF423 domain-containing protein [Bacteroidetes bacterium]|nr:DUF423 domain-containing protein [Bacteroidota bacterium]